MISDRSVMPPGLMDKPFEPLFVEIATKLTHTAEDEYILIFELASAKSRALGDASMDRSRQGGREGLSDVAGGDDLKKIDMPTLVVHGDDDQIVSIGTPVVRSATIIPDATLKVLRQHRTGFAPRVSNRLTPICRRFATSDFYQRFYGR